MLPNLRYTLLFTSPKEQSAYSLAYKINLPCSQRSPCEIYYSWK